MNVGEVSFNDSCDACGKSLKDAEVVWRMQDKATVRCPNCGHMQRVVLSEVSHG
jgi:uncharacterized Zn finger protein